MSKNKEITPENFHAFLNWLNSDSEKSSAEYENIQTRLNIYFSSRQCLNTEELADETIKRVILKINEIKDNYVGNRINYFLGVARNILFEYQRNKIIFQEISSIEKSFFIQKEESIELECLKICLNKLEKEDKQLLLDYFKEDGKAKIELRKQLAKELNINLNTLRIKVFHLKAKLEICVKKCLE